MSGEILTVYEKPTCTTCRRLVTVLEEEGVQPLTVEELRDPMEKAVPAAVSPPGAPPPPNPPAATG